MRRVLVALVAINVAFFAWHLYRRLSPAAAPVAAVDPQDALAPRIELLAEVDASGLRERVQAAPETTSVVVATSPSAEGPPAPASDAAPAVGDPAAPTEPAADALSEDAAIAAAEGPGVPDPAPIQEVLAAVMPPPAIPDFEDRLCYSVGPLTTPEEVAAMSGWLNARGGRATLREDERRELALYWVFVPPLESREAATALVERMRGQGLGDIYIIPRGDMANAISLGVYSRRASLERRLEQLRSRGHEPSITPRYRTKKASWFDVAFAGDFDFRASGFAEAFPAVEMSPGPCEGALPAGVMETAPPGRGLQGEDVSAGTFPVVGAAASADRVAADPAAPYDRAAPRRPYLYSGPETAAPAHR